MKRNKYLLDEISIQKKVISQLLTLLPSVLRLAKPNHGYCSYGHRQCLIDHDKYNLDKRKFDECLHLRKAECDKFIEKPAPHEHFEKLNKQRIAPTKLHSRQDEIFIKI